jgi:hypothetical protein
VAGGLGPLYQEVRWIREIAESRQRAASGDASGDPVRIAELSREVAELRATVARLRAARRDHRPHQATVTGTAGNLW